MGRLRLRKPWGPEAGPGPVAKLGFPQPHGSVARFGWLQRAGTKEALCWFWGEGGQAPPHSPRVRAKGCRASNLRDGRGPLPKADLGDAAARPCTGHRVRL